MLSKELKELIGNIPNIKRDSEFKKSMRFHQSWWRAFILAEEQGLYPQKENEVIGNTIKNGDKSKKNFLSKNIHRSVEETFKERENYAAGILDEEKLFNNLLSSQSLCFNFFGELKQNRALALNILQCHYKNISKVNWIMFEYKPEENYTNDKSAFDVLIEVEQNKDKGLIGFECKYVDSLYSRKEYSKIEYRETYNQSKIFLKDYEVFIRKRYNQLFRNQLMAEAIVKNNHYNFVYTGVFCHHNDKKGQEIAYEFRNMLDPKANFQIITYKDFIENAQRLELSWKEREWTMMLWTRYCSTNLSDNCR